MTAQQYLIVSHTLYFSGKSCVQYLNGPILNLGYPNLVFLCKILKLDFPNLIKYACLLSNNFEIMTLCNIHSSVWNSSQLENDWNSFLDSKISFLP